MKDFNSLLFFGVDGARQHRWIAQPCTPVEHQHQQTAENSY